MQKRVMVSIVICIVMSLSMANLASAMGIATDYNTRVINVTKSTGEGTFGFRVQNMVGDEDKLVTIEITEGNDIAYLVDPQETYLIKAHTKDNSFTIKYELPKDAKVGDEYEVRFRVRTTTENGGMISFTQGIGKEFTIKVVPNLSIPFYQQLYFQVAVTVVALAMVSLVYFKKFRGGGVPKIAAVTSLCFLLIPSLISASTQDTLGVSLNVSGVVVSVHEIKPWDTEIIVGRNVSAYYNFSMQNLNPSSYSGIEDVSSLIDTFWINTSTEEINVSVPGSSTNYNHTNVTNVTVQKFNWNLAKTQTTSYDIYNYTETLRVYEPNVTKTLPVKYNITTFNESATVLEAWSGREDILTVLKVDGSETGLSYTTIGTYPLVYPLVEITIATTHASSIDEGDHSLELVYYVSRAAPAPAPAEEAPGGVIYAPSAGETVVIPALDLTLGPFPLTIIPEEAIGLIVIRNETEITEENIYEHTVFNQKILEPVKIILPRGNYTILAYDGRYNFTVEQTIFHAKEGIYVYQLELTEPTTIRLSLENGEIFGQIISESSLVQDEKSSKPIGIWVIGGGLILLAVVVYLFLPDEIFDQIKDKLKMLRI